MTDNEIMPEQNSIDHTRLINNSNDIHELSDRVNNMEGTLDKILELMQQEKDPKTTSSKTTPSETAPVKTPTKKRGRPKGSKNVRKPNKVAKSIRKTQKSAKKVPQKAKIVPDSEIPLDSSPSEGIISVGPSTRIPKEVGQSSQQVGQQVSQQSRRSDRRGDRWYEMGSRKKLAVAQGHQRYNRPNNFEDLLGGRKKTDNMFKMDKRLDKILSGDNEPSLRDRGLDVVEATCSKCDNVFDIPRQFANIDPDSNVCYFTCDSCIQR